MMTQQKTKPKTEITMETFVSIMEALMVICFGISWPLNIAKAWKARTAKSISLPFYSLIWTGYIFAMIGKFTLIASNAPQPWYVTVRWYVMLSYVLNILMVSIGIAVYFRNRAIDRRTAAASAKSKTAKPADKTARNAA